MGIEAESQDGADSGGDSSLALDMALQRARGARGGRDPIADALIATQTEKLRHELHHLKLRTANEWFALVLKGIGLLLGAAIVAALAAMAWQASHSHALIVEPFHTPPDMAEKGLDGEVLASTVLDKLEAMRSSTLSMRAASGYSAEPASEAKLEIPDTGVSIGDVRHALQDWLGHDSHISGSLMRDGARDQSGLVLSVRTAGNASTFTGPESDLDHLTTQAAEAIFGATQPLAYADYLRSHDRADEALDLLKRLISTGDHSDRAWAYLALGEVLQRRHDAAGALHAYNEAAALNPNLWLVWEDIADLKNFGNSGLQDEESALANRLRAIAATDFGGADPNVAAHFHLGDEVYVAEARGDFAAAFALTSKEADEQPVPDLAYQSTYLTAYEAAYMHDIALTRIWARRAQDRAFAVHDLMMSNRTPARVAHRLNYWQWWDVGEWARAAAEMHNDNLTPTGSEGYWHSLEAIALARAGRPAEATALMDRTPERCYFCAIARGFIAETSGNRAAADAIFQGALRSYPSLVRASEFWGEIRLARGDAAGGIALFAAAHDKGPHYADPLEGWGEALLRQGDNTGAVAKFEEADKYAPNWGRNHLRWGQALARLGQQDDARAQFAKAATLALSAADRAALPR